MSKKYKKKKENKILKYYVDNSIIGWKIVLCILFVIGYIVLNYYENSFSISFLTQKMSKQEVLDMQHYIKWFNIGKNILIVLISVFLSSVITSFFTIKENNHIVSNLLTNDVFSSEDFYNNLSEENREKIYNNIDVNRLLDGSEIKSEMLLAIKTKLKDLRDDYYYENCYYEVKCTINDDFIQKDISKTMKLSPILQGKDVKIKNFLIASSKYIFDKEKGYGLRDEDVRVLINDKEINKDKYIKSTIKTVPDLEKKSGYNEFKRIECSKTISLSEKKPVKIHVEYTTIAPINDTAFVSRLEHACKSYSFDISTKSNNGKQYLMDFAAFGFVDNAGESPVNTKNEEHINISFDNWIFPEDGVSITFKEKY